MKTSGDASRRMWKLLFLQLVLLLSTQQHVRLTLGQEATAAVPEEKTVIHEQDLDSMSDEELEAICTKRGFELYRELDEDTGNTYVFTHEDYVEAARQCLAVEREMGEILAEHPELVDELKGEVDSMMAEKERLEKEIDDVEKKRADKVKEPPRAFVPHEGGTDAEGGKNETETEPATKTANTTNATAEVTEGATADVTQSSTAAEKEKEGEPVESDKEPVGSIQEEMKSSATQNVSNVHDEHNQSIAEPPTKDLIEEEPMSFTEEFVAEVRKDLREKREILQNVLNKVSDKLIPKPIRGPLKIVLSRVFRVAKGTGASALSLLNRYLRAFLQNATRKCAQKEIDNKEAEVEEETIAQDDLKSTS